MAGGDWSEEVDRLNQAYIGAGGKPEGWNRLYLRTDLEDGLFSKVEYGEPADTFKELVEHTLSAGDLVLFEVKVNDGNPKGLGLARILDLNKHAKLEYTAKIRFLAAEDPDYSSWAREGFNEKQDCRPHFCNGIAQDCKVKSRSKSISFAHADSWRLCSYRSVMRSPWAGAAALEDLSVMVSRWIRDYGERGLVETAPPSPYLGDGDELDDEMAQAKAREEQMEQRELEEKGARSPPRRERQKEARAERTALEAGRGAMLAMRGGSPQLIPGEGQDDKPEKGLKPEDPRRLAAPKPAASKVSLVPAGVRGKEPWMDDVSDLGGAGGDPKGEAREVERSRRRKRDFFCREKEKEKDRAPPVALEAGRGGFFEGEKKKDVKKKRKKERDRRRRRKSTSYSSSRSDREDSSEGSLYGQDKSRHTPLAEKARKRPGRLLKSGLEEMSKYLARRLGEGSREVGSSWREQRVGAYVSQVLMVQHPAEKMGPRNAREIQTLSLALDALMDGQYALCGDYLMQRLKAVESSLTDGWKVAEQQEIVPPARASLTSDAERSFAAKRAVQAQKLLNVVKQR